MEDDEQDLGWSAIDSIVAAASNQGTVPPETSTAVCEEDKDAAIEAAQAAMPEAAGVAPAPAELIILGGGNEDFSCLPTPPPSPTTGVVPVEGVEANQEEIGKEKKRPVGALVDFTRTWPFFNTMANAAQECARRVVRTEHAGVNNCLCFAYLVASKQMGEGNQKKQ